MRQASADINRLLLGWLAPRWGINDRDDAIPPFLQALRSTMTLHDLSSSNGVTYARSVF